MASERNDAVLPCFDRVRAYERERLEAARREEEQERRYKEGLNQPDWLSVRAENPVRGAGLDATSSSMKTIGVATLSARGLEDVAGISSRLPGLSTDARFLATGAQVQDRISKLSDIFSDDPLVRLRSSSLLTSDVLAKAGVFNPLAHILTQTAIMTILNMARGSMAEFDGAVEAFDASGITHNLEAQMTSQNQVMKTALSDLDLASAELPSLAERLAALDAQTAEIVATRSQDASDEMRRVAEARVRARERERQAREQAVRDRRAAEQRARDRQRAANQAYAEQAARAAATPFRYSDPESNGPDAAAVGQAILGIVDAYVRSRGQSSGGYGSAGYAAVCGTRKGSTCK